jgi:multidrug efflux pump subunit AcrA (membrane-fusion protein)
LHSAKQSLHDANLRSTINGTITSLDLSVGQQVTGSTGTGSSGSSDSSGSSQVEVQSSKSFVVDASVDDTEISQVKKGQTVDVTPDGATFPVTGKVSSVSSVPSSESGVVTFPVTVTLTGHPSGVYAGASATMSITTKKVSNVLEIPTLAITYDGSKASVKISSGGSTHTRTITVGTSYGLETQVLSGLTSGEKVVVTIPTFARFTGRPGGGTGGEGSSRTFTGGEGGTFGTNPFGSNGTGGSGGFGQGAPFGGGG